MQSWPLPALLAAAHVAQPEAAEWLEQHLVATATQADDWVICADRMRGVETFALVNRRRTGDLHLLPGSWRHALLASLGLQKKEAS